MLPEPSRGDCAASKLRDYCLLAVQKKINTPWATEEVGSKLHITTRSHKYKINFSLEMENDHLLIVCERNRFGWAEPIPAPAPPLHPNSFPLGYKRILWFLWIRLRFTGGSGNGHKGKCLWKPLDRWTTDQRNEASNAGGATTSLGSTKDIQNGLWWARTTGE